MNPRQRQKTLMSNSAAVTQNSPNRPAADLQHVQHFVFDLDNTLYPADCHLFAQIDARMTQFIEKALDLPHSQARHLQKSYYTTYGTTLSGLMKEHNIAPEDFLSFVHDIDLSPVQPNVALRKAITALPGKHYIFTNGSVAHAENVAAKIGILDLFEGIFDIIQADYLPKPHQETYTKFIKNFNITPKKAAMFEDISANLVAAHAMGLTTILIQSAAPWLADEPADKRPAQPGERPLHVDHTTQDLTSFLDSLTTTP